MRCSDTVFILTYENCPKIDDFKYCAGTKHFLCQILLNNCALLRISTLISGQFSYGNIKKLYYYISFLLDFARPKKCAYNFLENNT